MKRIIILTLLFILFIPLKFWGQETTAKIYIMRKQTISFPSKPEISVNDISIGNLSNKKYIECIVPAGNVSVSAYYSLDGSRDNISFQAEPGQIYHVKVSLNFSAANSGMNMLGMNMQGNNSTVANLKISRTTPNDGEKVLRKCKQELVADISDYVSTDNPMHYAQQPYDSENYSKSKTLSPTDKIANSDVDINIPYSDIENKNTFVLIIANEDYAFVDNVELLLVR